MINKYVSCEDCKYQDWCENFDAFSGCSDGEPSSKNSNEVFSEKEQ